MDDITKQNRKEITGIYKGIGHDLRVRDSGGGRKRAQHGLWREEQRCRLWGNVAGLLFFRQLRKVSRSTGNLQFWVRMRPNSVDLWTLLHFLNMFGADAKIYGQMVREGERMYIENR